MICWPQYDPRNRIGSKELIQFLYWHFWRTIWPRRYRDWRMIKSGHQYIASFLNARAFVAKKDLRCSTYSQSYILLWWLDDRLWWLWLWWLLHCFESVYASASVQVQDELVNKVTLTGTSHNLIKLSLMGAICVKRALHWVGRDKPEHLRQNLTDQQESCSTCLHSLGSKTSVENVWNIF